MVVLSMAGVRLSQGEGELQAAPDGLAEELVGPLLPLQLRVPLGDVLAVALHPLRLLRRRHLLQLHHRHRRRRRRRTALERHRRRVHRVQEVTVGLDPEVVSRAAEAGGDLGWKSVRAKVIIGVP